MGSDPSCGASEPSPSGRVLTASTNWVPASASSVPASATPLRDVDVPPQDRDRAGEAREAAVGGPGGIGEVLARLFEVVGGGVELAERDGLASLLHRLASGSEIVADPEGGQGGDAQQDQEEPDEDEQHDDGTAQPTTPPGWRRRGDVVADGGDVRGGHDVRSQDAGCPSIRLRGLAARRIGPGAG